MSCCGRLIDQTYDMMDVFVSPAYLYQVDCDKFVKFTQQMCDPC